MKLVRTAVAALLLCALPVGASGPLGIYGIVEKVVFEPSEKSPERIQVWGAFAYVDGGANSPGTVSAAKRGYLYFKLPTVLASASESQTVKNEWADLKAIAGTGQAIGFGTWGYIGAFGGLDPGTNSSRPPYVIARAPRGGELTDFRVRPASEIPATPAPYQTNAGIVKLPAEGSHAAIVKQLRDALKQ